MPQEEGVGGLPSQRAQGARAGGKAAAPGWASNWGARRDGGRAGADPGVRKSAQPWGAEEKQPRPAGAALGSGQRWRAGRSRPRREKVCTVWGAGGVTRLRGRTPERPGGHAAGFQLWRTCSGVPALEAPSSFSSASVQWAQRHPS